jgi:hypothetical protein
MRLVTILTLWCVLANAAIARDLFVDNVGGDDRLDGGTPKTNVQGSGPCRTITRALQLAQRGDRIVLTATGEPYRESITLQGGRHSGSDFKAFMIDGSGAVLDGSQPVPQDAWEHVRGDVFRFHPPRATFQQLFLDGRPANRRAIAAEGKLPELQPLEWFLFDRELYFRVETGKLPQDYALTFAGHPVGITLYEVRHVQIRDLIVQGFQLDGINAHDSAFEVSLAGITSRGNGRSGVSIGGASRVTIDACLIGNNGAAQVRTEGWSTTRIVNSDILDNTAPAVVEEGGRVIQANGNGGKPADAAP